eukprot:gnl/TRDRNA2_/TRDRNA2_151410_c1_seq1.p1 gnl/TRDRNA2_/TRDRNA2_151410_c1~~gnl/TRDRNA2_/TRDRNA2_151410_c1_seq1.p1  ORF type:complete len:303 (+),score=49.32 gnl/TRDRNA2_/TRDRNA2_151410_c1_seq1:57-911(+)
MYKVVPTEDPSLEHTDQLSIVETTEPRSGSGNPKVASCVFFGTCVTLFIGYTNGFHQVKLHAMEAIDMNTTIMDTEKQNMTKHPSVYLSERLSMSLSEKWEQDLEMEALDEEEEEKWRHEMEVMLGKKKQGNKEENEGAASGWELYALLLVLLALALTALMIFRVMIVRQAEIVSPDDPRGVLYDSQPSLSLTFKKADDRLVTITAAYRPLGFDFQKQAPIVVSSVHAGGQAEALGLKVGMVLMAIDGKDLKNVDFDDQYGLLKARAKLLPARKEYLGDAAARA